MTIIELDLFFAAIFRKCNSMFINGLGERINFLIFSVGNFQDVVRKEKSKKASAAALAWMASWLFSIVAHFEQLPIAEAMSSKFGTSGCVYCGNPRCRCSSKKRAQAKLQKSDPDQLKWSISKWQSHLDRVYGKRNRRNGIENVINRLFREACEILELQMCISMAEASMEELEWEFALEIADAFSWILGAAIVLDIDLESAVFSSYRNGCPTCGHCQCSCSRFLMQEGFLRRVVFSPKNPCKPFTVAGATLR